MPRSPLASHLLTAAWAILLGALLLLPADAYDPMRQGWLDRLLESIPLIDKVTHALLFAVMAILARRSFAVAGVGRATLWTTVATVAYGLVLEVLQAPIPGRSPGALDMIANTVGAVGGAIMALSPGRSPNGKGRAPLADRLGVADPAVEEPKP